MILHEKQVMSEGSILSDYIWNETEDGEKLLILVEIAIFMTSCVGA